MYFLLLFIIQLNIQPANTKTYFVFACVTTIIHLTQPIYHAQVTNSRSNKSEILHQNERALYRNVVPNLPVAPVVEVMALFAHSGWRLAVFTTLSGL